MMVQTTANAIAADVANSKGKLQKDELDISVHSGTRALRKAATTSSAGKSSNIDFDSSETSATVISSESLSQLDMMDEHLMAEESKTKTDERSSHHKRSNSLGAVAAIGGARGPLERKDSIASEKGTRPTSGNANTKPGGDNHLTGLFNLLGFRGNKHKAPTAKTTDDLDISAHKPANGPPPPRNTRAREQFHHRCFMDDSVTVQKRKTTVLDDEEHEENPHLEDFLHPHAFVHVEGHEDADHNQVLHKETHILRPALVAVEESDSEEDNEWTGESPIADDEDAKAKANKRDDKETEVKDVVFEIKVVDEPVSFAPSKDAVPKRSCMKKAWGQNPDPPKPKRNITFHDVTVRDYGMTLGDHPCVSYGPPVMLSWDYTEYEPLSLDDYELHHPKRRTLRKMLLNYYRRRNILLLQGELRDDELKKAWRSVKKAQRQRYITRHYLSALPVRIVETAGESAVRKVKRRLSGSSVKTEASE